MGTRSHRRTARFRVAATAVGLALGSAAALTACGTDTREPPGVSPPAENPPAESPPGENPPDQPGALAVLTPADGDVVSVPFDVAVDAGTELGAIDDGLHHLHIWFEGSQNAPSVVTTATTTVDGDEIPAPTGATTMFVQVHTAEHEPAGEVVSISLTVNEDGGTDSNSPGSGYSY